MQGYNPDWSGLLNAQARQGQVLGQAGQQIGGMIAQKRQANKMQEVFAQGKEAFSSGDLSKIEDFSIQNPEMANQFRQNMQFADEQSEAQATKGMIDIISGADPLQVLTDRVTFIESRGGNPTDTLKEIEDYQKNPKGYQDKMRNLLAVTNPQASRELRELAGKDTPTITSPASVKETEWFMKQSPEVQKKHIELKRKTNPTMAQQLEQKQAESDIKVGEEGKKVASKGKAQRTQGYIDSGIEAADSLGNIARVSELLNSVETGGFDNAALRAKQMFGIESGDEAELSAGLGKAILSQLKPIFGAAFTAAEGERLERIEASFGKSTAGNKRLVEEVKKITERAARRGLSAAKSAGDDFTVQEIENILEGLKGGTAPTTNKSKAAPQTVSWGDLK